MCYHQIGDIDVMLQTCLDFSKEVWSREEASKAADGKASAGAAGRAVAAQSKPGSLAPLNLGPAQELVPSYPESSRLAGSSLDSSTSLGLDTPGRYGALPAASADDRLLGVEGWWNILVETWLR